MSARPLHESYRRWLEELWGGDPGPADQLVSASFVGHWPGRDVHGPAELAAMVAQTRRMFTEIHFALQVGPIAEGDLVATRWTGRGTTVEGGSASFLGNDLLRAAGGRFVEYWPASPSES